MATWESIKSKATRDRERSPDFFFRSGLAFLAWGHMIWKVLTTRYRQGISTQVEMEFP